jgi:hypothetical protein
VGSASPPVRRARSSGVAGTSARGSAFSAHSSLAGSKRVSRAAIASIPARIGSSGASAISRTVVPMEGKTSSFMTSPW